VPRVAIRPGKWPRLVLLQVEVIVPNRVPFRDIYGYTESVDDGAVCKTLTGAVNYCIKSVKAVHERVDIPGDTFPCRF
jgi:hypothetical protein